MVERRCRNITAVPGQSVGQSAHNRSDVQHGMAEHVARHSLFGGVSVWRSYFVTSTKCAAERGSPLHAWRPIRNQEEKAS